METSATARWYLEGGTYRCAECTASFSSETAVEAHFRTTHSSINSHYCSICQMNFKDSWHLKRHLFTHGIVDSSTPQVRNACALCGASFPDAWHLRHHQKTHEGGDMPATTPGPKRRSRRRGRPCSVVPIGHSMEPRNPAPEWSPDLSGASKPENCDNLYAEAMEYYCGICGEAVSKPKFAAHSLTHLHDVFEVRMGDLWLEGRDLAECEQCQGLSRRIRELVQVIDEAIN